MKCGAVILCGGRSTRMGLPKATLPFGSEAMLTRVTGVLRETVDVMVVVAAPGQPLPELPDDVQVVHDRREGRGPMEGLAVGLTAIAPYAQAAYVTSCDVPLLQAAFVQRLINLLDSHDIVVPKEGKFYHPLAAVYRTHIAQHAQRLLDADRLRPVYLFEEADTLEIPVDQLRDVDSQLASLKNVNSAADYFSACRAAGFTVPDDIAKKLTP